MRTLVRLGDFSTDSRVAPRAFEIASSMYGEDSKFFAMCYEATDKDQRHLVPRPKVVVRIGRRVVMRKEGAV